MLERATAVLLAANEDLTRPIGEEGDRELRSLLQKTAGLRVSGVAPRRRGPAAG